MLFQATLIMVFLADVSLSANPQFSLPAVNDPNEQGLKALAIKGIAKFKPGGSAMLLSLLIQGEPGTMPGGTGPGSVSSTVSPTTSGPSQPSSGPSQSGSSPSQSPGSNASPTPSSGGTGGYQGNDFEKESLDAHNKFRQVHGSQPMTLNKQMCDEAAAYAKEIADSGQMKHSTREQRNGQGENLSMGCSTNKGQTGLEAVTNWYNEVCSPGYQFERGRGQGGTGHFTQVVWNDSVELGIGKAETTRNRMKCTYIVGRYKPLGNFYTGNDDYKKNVKQGSFNRNSYCKTVRAFKKSSNLDFDHKQQRKAVIGKALKQKLGSSGHKSK